MLSEEQRARVTVVLVRARNPNNIGAVARAMHGFGFSDLRLVNDYSVGFEKAKSAVDASAILAAAREFPTVADAVADCSLVVGTTAVGERKQEHSLYTLAQAGTLLRSTAATARVALLFGSEKTGLSNDAMSHCHWLMTIPMHPTPGLRHASMNLGQAAAVCLYELVRHEDPVSCNRIAARGTGRGSGTGDASAGGNADIHRVRPPPSGSRRSRCSAPHGAALEPESIRCPAMDRHPSPAIVEDQRVMMTS